MPARKHLASAWKEAFITTPQRRGTEENNLMGNDIMVADAELRSLGDYLERILLSNPPDWEDSEANLSLFACYGLASTLAERTDTFRTLRLAPDLVKRLVGACREELAPLERAIEQVNGWSVNRLVPSEIGEDELTLRWLFAVIERYLDGREAEFSALPAHQLNRVVREVRLMQVWDVADAEYQRGLRLALRHLERAIIAAVYAPRN